MHLGGNRRWVPLISVFSLKTFIRFHFSSFKYIQKNSQLKYTHTILWYFTVRGSDLKIHEDRLKMNLLQAYH